MRQSIMGCGHVGILYGIQHRRGGRETGSGGSVQGQHRVYIRDLEWAREHPCRCVVLTEAGAAIIEQKGKDPQTAAKIVLERLLKKGRDPFETQILLTVPYGHAEHFARFGNYETLPTLAD